MSAKKVRHVDVEYAIAREKASRHMAPSKPLDIGAIEIAAYTHGYARALMDVADGKVDPPKPDWRNE